MVLFTTLVNFRLLSGGTLHEGLQLVISPETGTVLRRTGYIGGEIVDLEDAIVAPGFLELQINGWEGVHFSGLAEEGEAELVEVGVDGEGKDGGDGGKEGGKVWERKGRMLGREERLEKVARGLLERGVTGFWATVPTVEGGVYEKILPHLTPRSFPASASLLGAHVEGPYLQPSKRGAHTSSHLTTPTASPASSLYGASNLSSSPSSAIKLVTLAPELSGSIDLTRTLTASGIRVSLGHSTASHSTGLEALGAGATGLTHVFNAMNPLHHREPGLVGLIAGPLAGREDATEGQDVGKEQTGADAPYFSIIADGIHLHPAAVALAYRANPRKAMLITDATELAGCPDGLYPGNLQISSQQRKVGGRVTLASSSPNQEEETLIGSATGLDTCVRNLMSSSGCTLAEAVRCVTENVADFMGVKDRGRLEEGCRADFVVLGDGGEVLQTWIAGEKAWDCGRPLS